MPPPQAPQLFLQHCPRLEEICCAMFGRNFWGALELTEIQLTQWYDLDPRELLFEKPTFVLARQKKTHKNDDDNNSEETSKTEKLKYGTELREKYSQFVQLL